MAVSHRLCLRNYLQQPSQLYSRQRHHSFLLMQTCTCCRCSACRSVRLTNPCVCAIYRAQKVSFEPAFERPSNHVNCTGFLQVTLLVTGVVRNNATDMAAVLHLCSAQRAVLQQVAGELQAEGALTNSSELQLPQLHTLQCSTVRIPSFSTTATRSLTVQQWTDEVQSAARDAAAHTGSQLLTLRTQAPQVWQPVVDAGSRTISPPGGFQWRHVYWGMAIGFCCAVVAICLAHAPFWGFDLRPPRALRESADSKFSSERRFRRSLYQTEPPSDPRAIGGCGHFVPGTAGSVEAADSVPPRKAWMLGTAPIASSFASASKLAVLCTGICCIVRKHSWAVYT